MSTDSNDDTRSLARLIGASSQWTHLTRRDVTSRRVSPGGYEVIERTSRDNDLLERPLENAPSETRALIRR